MKKVIIAALAALSLSACSTSSKSVGCQNHLRTSPKVNFYKHDNGGCCWHNN